jgi:signal transduction histidine kinase
VAHEVGNPVGALLAFLDLVARDPDLSDASRATSRRRARQVERVRSILRDLLGFARPTRGECAPVDLARVAEEVLELVRTQRRYAGVGFVSRSRARSRPRSPTAPRSHSSWLNLVVNAGDAVRTQRRRGARPRSRRARLDRRAGDDAGSARERSRSDAVEMRIEDDGPGVPESDASGSSIRSSPPRIRARGPASGLANALRCAEAAGAVASISPRGRPGCRRPSSSHHAAGLLTRSRRPSDHTQGGGPTP